MSKVRICVDLSEAELRAYREEAERLGISVERLVEDMVKRLMQDEKLLEDEGTDHPILPS
jgi:hypothetical protein